MFISNREKFITTALKTHGIRYNYDQVVYINNKTKVLIGCPIHGYFHQKPNSHLQGQGCPKCAAEKRGLSYTLTTEEFIAKARLIHGDYYDYSKTIYVNTYTKVIIICPIHGEFTQKASEHIRGLGCLKCSYIARSLKTRSNTEDFIKKARAIHGDRYDYSKSVYINNYTKVTIICSEHGEFEQSPNSHLLDQGCPKCAGKIKLTLEDFIKKAIIVHGNLYDYSKSVYINMKTPIEIICKKHGSFFQTPGNHTQGSGCPFCMTRVIVDTAEFIKRARARHGDLYNYSKSVFVDGKSMVIIGCEKHGEFEQAASDHIRGRGCKKCAEIRNGELNRINTEEFIKRARLTHGDLFNYDETIYIDHKTKIKIKCELHGIYSQVPSNHLNGSGCPICKSSKGELAIYKILKKYNIECEQEYTIPNQIYKFRYDFYIPSGKILIEYNGIQHYKHIGYFGGESSFNSIKFRDAIKKDLAKYTKHHLIVIHYEQFTEVSEEEFERNLISILNKYMTTPLKV